jgi:hypothetical protein
MMIMMSEADWPWYADRMEEGRQILTQNDPDDCDSMQYVCSRFYMSEQEKRVAQRGGCEACGERELVTMAHKGLVCRRTWEPCPRVFLVQIINLFERAFDEQ